MKAITLLQPWAHAVMRLGKTIENRSWPTKYRGRLVIHAGLSLRKYRRIDPARFLKVFGHALPPPDDLLFGHAIGTVTLADCLPMGHVALRHSKYRMWASGPWCFVLEDPKPFKPVACKGALGLWEYRR